MRPRIFWGLCVVGLLWGLSGAFSGTAMRPSMNLAGRFEPPSAQNFLGTDHYGIDILTQVVLGARSSIGIAVVVVMISTTIGLVIGGWSGYSGGWIDGVVMGITEVVLSVPGVLLSMILTLLLEPSIWNLCFALSMTAWITTARVVRGEVLRLRSLEFVEAARALGARKSRILMVHLFPSVFSILLVTALNQLPGIILAEASLSYLGLGLPLEQISLGQMIAQGRKYVIESPLQTLAPGVALLGIVLFLQILIQKRNLNPWTRSSRT